MNEEADMVDELEADEPTRKSDPPPINIRLGGDDEEGESLSSILQPKRERSKPVIDQIGRAHV